MDKFGKNTAENYQEAFDPTIRDAENLLGRTDSHYDNFYGFEFLFGLQMFKYLDFQIPGFPDSETQARPGPPEGPPRQGPIPAQPKPGPAQARFLEIWEPRFGNLEAEQIPKVKIPQIKIHVAQTVGNVWISRGKKNPSPVSCNVMQSFHGREKKKKQDNAEFLPSFLRIFQI